MSTERRCRRRSTDGRHDFPKWSRDGSDLNPNGAVKQENHNAKNNGWQARRPVTLPASREALVSTRGAFRSSTHSSSDPCESRTNATSDANLEGRSRGSLGGRSRRSRRTRKSVVRLLACTTSTYGSRSSAIRNRKPNFDFIGMNAPTYYLKLQGEFRRLHGLGWTFRQMAEALDVSERTIVAWRQELNLPRRPRGRRPRKSRG